MTGKEALEAAAVAAGAEAATLLGATAVHTVAAGTVAEIGGAMVAGGVAGTKVLAGGKLAMLAATHPAAAAAVGGYLAYKLARRLLRDA